MLPVDVLCKAKARVLDSARLEYATMKLRGEIDSIRDGWFGQRLNNALLASIATYHDLVPGFKQTLRDNGGDLEKFYETVAGMKRLGKAERRKKLQAFSSLDTHAAPARS
ncbi:MAG: aminopeptidase [Verrucomicrobia bacterium]|nr:aminopeptidase [Verrucomicrobiota bacterium]